MSAVNPKHIVLPKADENHPEITLSVDRKPLKQPTTDSKRILIVGGGVSGLMIAWILLDKGYFVTILSKEWAWTRDWQHSRLTSQIAGALWEYPPGGCGLTEIESPGKGWAEISHYREWALQSYEFYKKLNSVEDGRLKTEFGVAITKLNQFFYHDLTTTNEQNGGDVHKLEAIREAARHQRIDNLKEHHVDDRKAIFDDLNVDEQWRLKLKDSYVHDAPIINTDKAMGFLMSLVKNKGAELETREVKVSLKSSADELAHKYGAKAIVNATGMGAKVLASDEDVYPVRGAIKRIENNDSDYFEHINQAYLVPAQKGDDGQPTKVVFWVPRNDETLIVGSIIQPGNDDLNLVESSPEVEMMWKRARTFLPSLNDSHSIPWYPLAQGVRPFTTKNVKVRAEKYSKTTVIHNYGHGGSGWTLAVGCARSAVHLLDLTIEQGMDAADANKKLYPQ